MTVNLTQTVKCRWCEHTQTNPHGWGAALTALHRHVVRCHPERQSGEPIEAR